MSVRTLKPMLAALVCGLNLAAATGTAIADDLFSDTRISSPFGTPIAKSKSSDPIPERKVTHSEPSPSRAQQQDSKKIGITLQSIENTLSAAGFSVERKNDSLVSTTIKRGKWDLPVAVFVEDSQRVWILIPLRTLPSGQSLPADKLVELLTLNDSNGPAYFSIRKPNNRIDLNTTLSGNAFSAEGMKNRINSLADIAEKTDGIWNADIVTPGPSKSSPQQVASRPAPPQRQTSRSQPSKPYWELD